MYHGLQTNNCRPMGQSSKKMDIFEFLILAVFPYQHNKNLSCIHTAWHPKYLLRIPAGLKLEHTIFDAIASLTYIERK